MQLDCKLFEEMLAIDSVSGTERGFAEFLSERLVAESVNTANSESVQCEVEQYEVGDGTLNLLFKWGCAPGQMPKVYLCSHLDTVPPYIPPKFKQIAEGEILPDGTKACSADTLITGRGSNDAKGQIFSMWSACHELQEESLDGGYGLLLLAGEETGSYGAKAYTANCPGGEWVIVGEHTDNKMVSSSKGTKAFEIKIHGKACHSGYPELGTSAVGRFVDFVNVLRSIVFPSDPMLGATTWNIGKLTSDNPQNILSPLVEFRLYFRTTFASDALVCKMMEDLQLQYDYLEIKSLGGDTPERYRTFESYPVTPVSFGSDTPRLTGFPNRAMCGPGTIKVAHTGMEYVLLSELEKAKEQYKDMIRTILRGTLEER